ncbi:MAG: replisome organizer [Clostridia bacterium]|nr:replisome organizer [Clostridia bacterium]
MARRRMFNLDIIDTDLFLEMPQTSRLLYYELCMRADDDGFVSSPKKIQKMVGCSEDDFKVLISKQFIIPFDTGVVVIRHWKLHNYIQKDRYRETIYTDEKKQLNQEENGMYTKCIQDGYKMETQVRLGKDSIGKDSKESKEEKPKKDNKIHFAEFVSMTNAEYEKLVSTYGKDFADQCITVLDNYKGSSGKKYKSDYRAILNWVIDRVKEQRNKQTSKSNYEQREYSNLDFLYKNKGVSNE